MTIWKHLAAFATFETQHLQIRPFSYEDLDDFHDIVANPDNLAFIFPSQPDKELAAELLVDRFMKMPLGVWALEEKQSGQMIGAIRLEKIDERARQAEIGYFLKKDYWGKGLMTEALKNLVYLSFYHLHLKQLTIITHLENKASQRVAEKAGFKQTGHYKGSDRYSHKTRTYLQFTLEKRYFTLEMYEENT